MADDKALKDIPSEVGFERIREHLEKMEITARQRRDLAKSLRGIQETVTATITGYLDAINVARLNLENETRNREAVEKALFALRGRFDNLIDDMPVGISVVTPDGHPIARNRYLMELYGYRSKEALMKTDVSAHYYDPEDLKRFVKRLGSGPVRDFEVRLKRIDGAPFWASLSAISQVAENGETHIITIVLDIDARKKLAESLKLTELKFRDFMENTPVGIGITTYDGRPVERNKAMVEMYGYASKEEMMYSSVTSRYADPEDRKRFLALTDKGIVRDFETQMKRKDGSVFWSSMTAIPYTDESKERFFITVIQDITRRKEAERELHESESRYRNLFESMAQGVLIRDKDGRIITVNNAAVEIIGLSRSELVGLTLLGRAVGSTHEDASDFPDETHPAMIALKTGREIDNVIMRFFNKRDRNYRWVRINARPLFRPGENKPYQVFSTFDDITQIKEMEDELKLRADLLDAANDAIFLRELEGKLIYINESVCRQSGYTRSELMGMNIVDLLAPEERYVFRPRHDEMMAKGGIRHETVHLCKDGTRIPVEVQSQVVSIGGRTLVMSVIRDISLRKKAEEELRSIPVKLIEMQEKERRSMALELHDELGQSLTALKLMVNRALTLKPDKVEPVLREALEVSDEAIKQVRDLSLNLRPPMLGDTGLLSALLWYIDRFQQQTGMKVTFKQANLGRNFPQMVIIGAFRIIQSSLTNVARHAGVKEVAVRVSADRDRLNIRIEDKGRGFDSTKLVPGRSTGLDGMRERAALLGGSFTVDTAPGAGTTITAVLPISQWAGREVKEGPKGK